MKTYHMYHSESISAESKLKEAEKQEEKQIGRGDQVFSIRMEDKYQRRSSVKKIEKMKEKVGYLGPLILIRLDSCIYTGSHAIHLFIRGFMTTDHLI